MRTPDKLSPADAIALERGNAFMADLKAAYDKAVAAGGLEPDDLAGIILCNAYAMTQLTFDLDRPGLASMVADTVRRYLASGAFERNRDINQYSGTMQ